MNPLKILIVDDEAPARRKLVNFLTTEDHLVEILEAEDGVEAIKMVNTHQPDLVLLDIQMPGKTGFEVIEDIGAEQMPAVIFITAFDQFALQAFTVQALDYLLKPFDRERFQKAFQRAIEQIQLKNSQAHLLEKLLSEVRKKETYLERLLVTSGNHHILLAAKDILYFQSDDKYVRIRTAAKTYLLRESLSELEQKLNPADFARIHRSYLVNLHFIRQLTPRSHGDYWVELSIGERLVMSRRYRNSLFR